MSRTAVVFIIISMVYCIHAQTIDINGNVTDQSGDAVPFAVVTLESEEMSDTTDLEGQYSLYKEVSGVEQYQQFESAGRVELKNGRLVIRRQKQEQIRIEIFNMRGKLIKKRIEKPVSAGMSRIDLDMSDFASNMMVVRVSIGQQTFRYRYLPLNGKMSGISASVVSGSSSGTLMAKKRAVVDSLHVSALGYNSKNASISSYEERVDIVLDANETYTCTGSNRVDMNVSGSGPHQVVVETNADQGINEGTIYRPSDIGPGKNYPVFVWGEGGCSLDGASNSTAMAEIASHGYIVVADGTPEGSGSRPMEASEGENLLEYIDWVIAENRKPCSVYYQSIDTTKVATNGFSCGGMLAMGTAHDLNQP